MHARTHACMHARTLPEEQEEAREDGDPPEHEEGGGLVGGHVPLHQGLDAGHVVGHGRNHRPEGADRRGVGVDGRGEVRDGLAASDDVDVDEGQKV